MVTPYLNWMAPMGHTRTQTAHPVHLSSWTMYEEPFCTIAPFGQARLAGQKGLLSQWIAEI